MKKVKITILKTTLDKELAAEYGIDGLTACPMMKAGDVFYADYAKPQGFCDEAFRRVLRLLAELTLCVAACAPPAAKAKNFSTRAVGPRLIRCAHSHAHVMPYPHMSFPCFPQKEFPDDYTTSGTLRTHGATRCTSIRGQASVRGLSAGLHFRTRSRRTRGRSSCRGRPCRARRALGS